MCLFTDAEKATEDNPDGYSVARLCRVLGINRPTHYAWLASRPATVEPHDAEEESAEQIRAIHVNSPGPYRAPRVHAELRRVLFLGMRRRVAQARAYG